MFSPRFARWLFLSLALGAVATSTGAADTEQAFRNAKRSIQQQLGNKNPEARIAAISELEEYPVVDAAKLLFQIGFKDQPPEVRSAAYEALLKLSDNEDIAEYLNTIVRRDARHKTLPDETVPIVAALLVSQREGVDRDSLELIEKSATGAKRGLVSLIALADDLGVHGDQADLRALAKLTKTRAFAAEFAFRRAVVQAIIRIHTPEAVEVLIGLLADLKGEVRADVIDILQKIAGQPLVDHVGWTVWWKKNKTEFHYPPLPPDGGPRRLVMIRMPLPGSYDCVAVYPIYGNRVVFMLDMSQSMTGANPIVTQTTPDWHDNYLPSLRGINSQKLVVAKRELINAISRLDEDATFSIIIYNSSSFGGIRNERHLGYVWQKRLQRATPQMKRNASMFVQLEAMGQTANDRVDVLGTAFALDPESIYFFTDGELNSSKLTSTAEMVRVINKNNRLQRASIHTVAIGVGVTGGPSEKFLRTLAEKNFGTFRRVDE